MAALSQIYNPNAMLGNLARLSAIRDQQQAELERYRKNQQAQQEMNRKNLAGLSGSMMAREVVPQAMDLGQTGYSFLQNGPSMAEYGPANAWNIYNQANTGQYIINPGSEAAIHANPDPIPYTATPEQLKALGIENNPQVSTSASTGTTPPANAQTQTYAPVQNAESASTIAPAPTTVSSAPVGGTGGAAAIPGASPQVGPTVEAAKALTTGVDTASTGGAAAASGANALGESGNIMGAGGQLSGELASAFQAPTTVSNAVQGAETAANAAGGATSSLSTALPILGVGAGIAGMAMSGKVTAGGMAQTIGSAMMLIPGLQLLGGLVALGGTIASLF